MYLFSITILEHEGNKCEYNSLYLTLSQRKFKAQYTSFLLLKCYFLAILF